MANPGDRTSGEGRRGHVDSAAAAVERARESLLAALGKTYSIVVLASLSLVIAAFARSLFPDAVPYAVAASSAFFAAVVLTLIHELRVTGRSAFHIEVGSATIVPIVAGFVMLGMVVGEFARRDLVTQRVTLPLLGSFTLVAFAASVLGMHEAIDRIRGTGPDVWARRGRILSVAPWIAAAGCVVLAGSLVLFVFGIPNTQVVTAVGLLAFLGPFVYLRGVGRTGARPA